MNIVKLKVTNDRSKFYGQVLEGYYLNDGTGDARVLTNNGPIILYDWEFEYIGSAF